MRGGQNTLRDPWVGVGQDTLRDLWVGGPGHVTGPVGGGAWLSDNSLGEQGDWEMGRERGQEGVGRAGQGRAQ